MLEGIAELDPPKKWGREGGEPESGPSRAEERHRLLTAKVHQVFPRPATIDRFGMPHGKVHAYGSMAVLSTARDGSCPCIPCPSNEDIMTRQAKPSHVFRCLDMMHGHSRMNSPFLPGVLAASIADGSLACCPYGPPIGPPCGTQQMFHVRGPLSLSTICMICNKQE